MYFCVNIKVMEEKHQITSKIDKTIVEDFDKALLEFKEATGAKIVRQDAIGVAMKDYTVKLRKQIEVLKQQS